MYVKRISQHVEGGGLKKMNIGRIGRLYYLAEHIRLKRKLKRDTEMIKTSGLIIINLIGEVLLAHPTNHSPKFWSIPKGQIEEGESDIEAAIRETLEEVNMDFYPLYETGELKWYEYPIEVYKHKKKCLQPFVVYELENRSLDFTGFELKCTSYFTDKDGNELPEMDKFQWFTLEEAIELVHPTQKNVLKKLIK